ncbi:AfsR/SARP family transcriptional regulator [Veillonella montpellierensis]|uniref:AfsR/SARP family transcriptional regulator n=1 Tax=Veillonella montpellierensis TaxID=187328 RepID=UPI0004043E0F|nr:BTAD domain-containing putative transcriptional regulator [Veillonella montpellierensis]
MAEVLEVNLLGTPRIIKDGKEMFFSYNKVNALVYYIIIKKSVMRDELGGLLWPDKTEVIARKNLRNALYEAKKLLGENVFISPVKSVIQLNEETNIFIDVDRFLLAPIDNIKLYKGEFLQGFFTKGSVSYEEWYLSERRRIKQIYLKALVEKINIAKETEDFIELESYARMVLSEDPYNEDLYAMLIRTYIDLGKPAQAIAVYELLKEIFEKDDLCAISDDIEDLVAPLRKAQQSTALPTKDAINEVAALEAVQLEKELSYTEDDELLYRQLIATWEKAGNIWRSARYKIKLINYEFERPYAPFPFAQIIDLLLFTNKKYIFSSESHTLLHQLDALYEAHQSEDIDDWSLIEDNTVRDFFSSYYMTKARYCILVGDVAVAKQLLLKIIAMPEDIHKSDYLLAVYRQLIFLKLFTDTSVDIENIFEAAMNLAMESNYHKELGILLRLQGILHMQCKQWDIAEQFLKNSMDFFKVTQTMARRYGLHIGAAMYYLGYIAQEKNNIKEAALYYKTALDVCKHTHMKEFNDICYSQIDTL